VNIESSEFRSGEMIPAAHTCDGADLSPPLRWSDPPAGTKSFALICDDPDAPAGTWVHWLLWNLPSGARALPAGVGKVKELPDGSRQGTNDFRRIGYGGPCPPAGTHRYFFHLYALDTLLSLSHGADRRQLDTSMRGHILGEGELMGKYRRA
jgi:Raf kinase inhibitor-like YbhB/YbcL family protein